MANLDGYVFIQFRIPIQSQFEDDSLSTKVFNFAITEWDSSPTLSEMKKLIQEKLDKAILLLQNDGNWAIEVCELQDVMEQLNYMKNYDWNRVGKGIVLGSIRFPKGQGCVKVLEIQDLTLKSA